MNRYFLLLMFAGLIWAQGNCYRSKRLEVAVRGGDERVKLFTTFDEWAQSGEDTASLSKAKHWYVRDSKGFISDEELLRRVGFDKQADKMHKELVSRRSRSTVGLIVGVPLGIALAAGGGVYMKKSLDKEPQSTLEVGTGGVALAGGIGIVYASIAHFFSVRRDDPNKHELTLPQVLDMISRQNTVLKARCASEDKNSN